MDNLYIIDRLSIINYLVNNNYMELTVFKMIRDKLGLSQSEFAKSIGLEQGSYSGLESGKKGSLTKQTALLLNLVHGVSMDYLYKGEGDIFELRQPVHKVKIEESSTNMECMPVEASCSEFEILQKKVIGLLEENLALQKKVIQLLEENKKQRELDTDNYIDFSLGEKMLEEMREYLSCISQRNENESPKSAI